MTELQEKLLNLLKITDELCRKYEVDYYLLGGSLIGAMRHGGFIPWDDDADVIMSRDNWEKFYYSAKDSLPEGYKFSTQYDDINVAMPINRLTETTTTGLFRYHLAAIETAGTQIDIFVMDPVPDTEDDKEIYRTAIAEFTELTALHVSYAYRFGKNTNFKKNWERIQKDGKKEVLEEITKKAFHYSEDESQLYAQRFAGAPHFWPKEVFGKPQYVPFEDTMLPIPERPGDCLVIGYDDDWKYIPRSGSNLSTHEFAVRSYTTPSHVIWEDYINHIDNNELIKAFVERKYEWERQFDERFPLECEIQQFAVEKVRCKYQKLIKDVNLKALIENNSYEELMELFAEYIEIQSNNKLLGSASLTGRMQYYRRNHPNLIDIGDEAIYAVLISLIHYQRLGLAAKIMNARKTLNRPLTEDLTTVDNSIKRVRDIISTYGVGEYDECRRLVDEGLLIDSSNPFYIKHDIFLKNLNSEDEKFNNIKIREGLKVIPDDSELLLLLAENLRNEGLKTEAMEVYDKLIELSDDGLVLKRIREVCEGLYVDNPSEENKTRWLNARIRSGESCAGIVPEDEEESHCDSDEDNEFDKESSVDFATLQEKLGDVQAIRFSLLKELRDICDKNNISYFLSGNALWQAQKYKRIISEYGEIAVIMTAEDAIAFQNIVNGNNSKNRVVESMINSPNFYRLCMRYSNTESLDMNINTCNAVKHPGIGITIEILRPVEKNRFDQGYNRMLEKGWESRTGAGRTDRRTAVCESLVNKLCNLKGLENASKYIFDKLTKGSDKTTYNTHHNLFVKNYDRRRFIYSGTIFDGKVEVELEGEKFATCKGWEQMLQIQFGKRWKDRNYNKERLNEFTRIIDADIPCDEYIDHLIAMEIDLSNFQQRWKESRQKYKTITTTTKLASKHWYFLATCGERQNLYDEYRGIKPDIMRAYESKNLCEVEFLIKSYYDRAMEYYGRKLALYFDKELFDVLIWYIKEKNYENPEIAEELIRYQQEQQWGEKGM